MLKIGDIIDNRYNVISHLGTGGMAVVFECEDLFTGKTVALKILKEELLNDKESLLNFTKEVNTSVSMYHQNIIEIFEEGVYQNRPYLVMEYLNDQTLLDKLEYYTKFTVKEACEIMLQLLDAISYTHEHDLIHRDIKPQNVFYLPNGIIKLADFGIASNSKETNDNDKIIGSVHYLAPEVLTGRPFSVASDIYAAGITFFQLITGLCPFDGSTKEISQMHLKQACPKPSTFNKQIPSEIDDIILTAVSKNPGLRYSTAIDFKAAIENFLSGKKEKHSIFSKLF